MTYGVWPSFCISNHLSPKGLISKERDDDCGSSVKKPASRGSSTSMMDHCGYLLEQPLMGTIFDVEDILAVGKLANPTPASGYDSANATCFNGVQQDFSEMAWIVNHNATEANIDWWWARREEVREVLRRYIRWHLPEEESANIFICVSDVLYPII